MFSAHPMLTKKGVSEISNNTGIKLSPLRNEGCLSNEVAQGVAAPGAEIYRQDCHGLKAFTER